MKKYITTIMKYAFSLLLVLASLKITKDFKIIIGSILELIAIFGVSNILIKKSKWFNILNSILVLLFNSELIVLLYANSFITLVMLQSLTSVEDLQGKAFIYIVAVSLVLVFSVLPITHIEKLDKVPLAVFPILLAIDMGIVFMSDMSFTPYAGARDLYTQWHDYSEMKRLVAEMKNGNSANDYSSENEFNAEDDASSDLVNENNDNNSSNISDISSNSDVLPAAEDVSDETALQDNADVSESAIDTIDAATALTSESESSNELLASNAENANNSEVTTITNTEATAENGNQTTAVSNTATTNTTTTNNQAAVSKGNGLDPKMAKQFPVGVAMPHNTLPNGTNVIVIFVEGLSKNVITDARGIMPNLAAFKNECITFNNYYNHTFATYRGIQGQLYSGHSLDDFETNHMPSIMDVLKTKGYNTVFINVEPYNKDFTNYLKAMSFDKVLSSKDESDSFAGSLSDRQAYSMLFDTAKEYQNKGKPFFLCLYSFGTHMSFDTDENVYGDGSNNFMNRYYNCDYQLGAFIDNFKASPLSKNTLLVITGDHSAYADEDFIKTFPDYVRQHPACDQMPLYLYYNGITTSINAGGRNSLDLAPTILDLLGYERPASFLGYSLYGAQNESTILDSFFWNPDGLSYTGGGSISAPDKKVKEFVNGEVIRYISNK